MQSPSRCNKRTRRYGPPNNPVSCTAYLAENENLGKFEAVENNGTAFVPKQGLYHKVAVGMENPRMQSPSRWNKRTGRYGPGNNPVSCTAYLAENGNLGKFEAVENNHTAFARKQCLYQKVAVDMENPNMQSPSWCNKRTGRYGTRNNLVSCTAYKAENGNLGKFEGVKNNHTAFAPKQCLYQKVAVDMENPKMQSPSRCNKRTGRYGPGNNLVSCTAYQAENENLGKF